jgi:hypothetical protein
MGDEITLVIIAIVEMDETPIIKSPIKQNGRNSRKWKRMKLSSSNRHLNKTEETTVIMRLD